MPRATSALNAIQRVAGATGSALLAIVLQHAVAAEVAGAGGGVEGIGALARRPGVRPLVADAFATTFWVAVTLIALALVPALFLPSRPRRAERAEEPRLFVPDEQRRSAA